MKKVNKTRGFKFLKVSQLNKITGGEESRDNKRVINVSNSIVDDLNGLIR